MKKLVLIILIAVLACGHAGYYVIIHFTQYEHKRTIQEKILRQLKDEELEIISLTDHEQNIYWEEEDKEFLFNGEMYDVVKSKTINGKTILYCINDKKEKALIDKYNLETNNSNSDKKGKTRFNTSLNLFLNVFDTTHLMDKAEGNKRFYPFDSQLFDNLAGEISPPPKA